MKILTPRPYVVDRLQYALNPAAVAVVGASSDPHKVGYRVIEGLRKSGYEGAVYPVALRDGPVLGLRAYKSLRDIPDPVDLAFIAIPTAGVQTVVSDAVASGVKVVAVATGAFEEAGRALLQDQITTLCREHELPLLGPNFIGLGNPFANYNCSLAPYLPVKGPVGLVSQSGANLLGALGASQLRHYGLSFFVGLGNKADVDFSELILYGAEDPNTGCIAVYIESLDSPEAFVEACRAVVLHKPVLVIKVGPSRIGRKVAFAHTASENEGTDDASYDRLFEQAGVLRATVWQQFLDISMALGMQPPLEGANVVMVTNGGGSGLLSCDYFERLGMPLRELAQISPNLATRMMTCLPEYGSRLNPVDLSGTATPAQYEAAFVEAFQDANVHGVYGSICPTAVTDVARITDLAIAIHDNYAHLEKPFVMQCQGGHECNDAIIRLRDHGIPAYPTPEPAVNGLVALRRYARIRHLRRTDRYRATLEEIEEAYAYL